jgi:Zn-dependent M28 family amino/carboxypeptidase
MTRPELFARGARPSSPIYKSLRIATGALAGLAAVDVVQLIAGRSRLLSLAKTALTIPPLIGFALNLEVVLRRQIVPGAMDDLSGIAGMLLLARRLAGRVPEDVEVVFVATGAEEAMLGGSQALAQDRRAAWDPKQTVIIGLDGLANGELRYFVEGEVFPVRLAPWLRVAAEEVAASDPRFAEVCAHEIPVGGTDSVPFAVAGYDAVTLGCVDPKLGMPREYHLPSDTPENLEVEKIPYCVDFAERLFERVIG